MVTLLRSGKEFVLALRVLRHEGRRFGEGQLYPYKNWAYEADSDDPVMTVVTPPIRDVKDGLVLAVDDQQAGQAFIDNCSSDGCETIIPLDRLLRKKLDDPSKLTFEYRNDQATGTRVTVNSSGFGASQKALARLVGVVDASNIMSSNESDRLKLAIGEQEFANFLKASSSVDVYITPKIDDFVSGVPTTDKPPPSACATRPQMEAATVTATDIKVDGVELSSWMENAKPCYADAFFYVQPAKVSVGNLATFGIADPSFDSRIRVYNALSKHFNKVVLVDSSGTIPILPPESNLNPFEVAKSLAYFQSYIAN